MVKKYFFLIVILISFFGIMGCEKGKMEIHHVFPQQLRGEFSKIDINVDDFGIRLTKADHRLAGGLHSQQWNKRWIEFFKSNEKVSKKKVMNNLDDMLVEAGFVGRLSFVKYDGVNKGIKTGEIIVKHTNWFLQFAGFIGEKITKLLGGTSAGSMIIGFFASLGSMVLGFFSIKVEHPVAVGIGFMVFILGLIGLIGIGYLGYLLYKWIMITIAASTVTVAASVNAMAEL